MYQYRQVLVRLRAGDSVREVARTGLMRRDKLGELCSVARQHGWLDAASDGPDDAAIEAALGQGRRVASSTISSVEPHRAVVKLRISAIVDACFSLIVDGETALSKGRWGSAQALGMTVAQSSTISLKRTVQEPVKGLVSERI